MFRVVDKQFIMDMGSDVTGAVVIDADLQGAWEFGDQEQMKWSFPRAYEFYRQHCLKGLARVGTCLLVEDSGYKVAILITKKHRKDSKETVLKNFEAAIQDLTRKVPSDVFIFSPVLGRADHCFSEMISFIVKVCKEIDGSVGYNWCVYNNKKGIG